MAVAALRSNNRRSTDWRSLKRFQSRRSAPSSPRLPIVPNDPCRPPCVRRTPLLRNNRPSDSASPAKPKCISARPGVALFVSACYRQPPWPRLPSPNGRRTKRCGSAFRAIPSCGSTIWIRRGREVAAFAARDPRGWQGRKGVAGCRRRGSGGACASPGPLRDNHRRAVRRHLAARHRGRSFFGSGKNRTARRLRASMAGAANMTCRATGHRRPPRHCGRPTGRRPTGSSKAARSTATAVGTVLTTEQCLLNPNRNAGLIARRDRGKTARRPWVRARRLARRGPRQ